VQNHKSAGALPQNPLGEITVLPRPPSWWVKRTSPSPRTLPPHSPLGLAIRPCGPHYIPASPLPTLPHFSNPSAATDTSYDNKISNFWLIAKGVSGLRVPKIWHFPLTLIVAVTTVLCTTVPHCDYINQKILSIINADYQQKLFNNSVYFYFITLTAP